MARSDTERAIEILGVSEVAQVVRQQGARRHRRGASAVELKGLVEARGEPKMWTELIRSRLPSTSLKRTAEHLGVSVNELSKTLRLPARTLHRRVEKRQKLTSEETERNVRAARVLARAQQLL